MHLASGILYGRTSRTWIQILRAACAGAVSLGVDVSLLALLTEVAHWHYLVSAVAGFTVGLLVNYALNLGWVFPRRRFANRWVEFPVFALIAVVGLGLTEAAMWSLTEVGGLHYLMSKAVATGVVFLWTFGSRKALLFP